jgi:hypothetical protein
MTEKIPHICYECDSEFYVFPIYEESEMAEISFCPYCGSELESIEEDEPEIDEEYFEDPDEE